MRATLRCGQSVTLITCQNMDVTPACNRRIGKADIPSEFSVNTTASIATARPTDVVRRVGVPLTAARVCSACRPSHVQEMVSTESPNMCCESPLFDAPLWVVQRASYALTEASPRSQRSLVLKANSPSVG